MEVILKQDIEKLGYKDDLVQVKDGYGRNYLIPKGIAILATSSAKKVHAETVRQRAQRVEKERESAQKLATKLKGMSITVGAKVGESGKIFGSVNNIQLAEEMAKLGIELERKNIKITGETIKSIGTYEAEVTFHRDVVETISFEVVGE
ncbi:MAG: 50S ribosomal protein L9 [Flavobacteriales bacterium]|nr:50S ribosomal protein L9 [Flavobacteriales bacterium]